MSVFLQPLGTQTVGAGGVSNVTFTNIPQNFTDLVLLVSARGSGNDGPPWSSAFVNLNNTGSNYALQYIYTDGSSVIPSGVFGTSVNLWQTGNTNTANTFGNARIVISNYSSGKIKVTQADSVAPNNAAASGINILSTSSFLSTAPVTSVTFGSNVGQTFVQGSTFTLYGQSVIYDTAAPAAPTLTAATDLGGVASFAFTANDTGTGQTADNYSVQDIAIMGSPVFDSSSPVTFPISTGVTYTSTIKANNAVGSGTSSSGSVTSYNNFGSIATVDVTSPVSHIYFGNIPQHYRHLQVRITARGTSAATSGYPYFVFNADGSASYTSHHISGNGISVNPAAYVNSAQPLTLNFPCANSPANTFGSAVIDILDYTSISKFKVARVINGWDNNSAGTMFYTSLVYYSLLPISSITFPGWDIANWAAGTRIALYGIG